mmetsp:Transcript_6695/g.16078  ORF Transcript_6695/g.16078 Transcript_6695/m.16078 type:complete len:318 (-) Transcript_6695:80-1033(-)
MRFRRFLARSAERGVFGARGFGAGEEAVNSSAARLTVPREGRDRDLDGPASGASAEFPATESSRGRFLRAEAAWGVAAGVGAGARKTGASSTPAPGDIGAIACPLLSRALSRRLRADGIPAESRCSSAAGRLSSEAGPFFKSEAGLRSDAGLSLEPFSLALLEPFSLELALEPFDSLFLAALDGVGTLRRRGARGDRRVEVGVSGGDCAEPADFHDLAERGDANETDPPPVFPPVRSDAPSDPGVPFADGVVMLRGGMFSAGGAFSSFSASMASSTDDEPARFSAGPFVMARLMGKRPNAQRATLTPTNAKKDAAPT